MTNETQTHNDDGIKNGFIYLQNGDWSGNQENDTFVILTDKGMAKLEEDEITLEDIIYDEDAAKDDYIAILSINHLVEFYLKHKK